MWEILLGLQGKVQIGEVIFIAIPPNMVSNMVTIMGTIMVTNMHRLTFAMRECLRDLQVGSPSSSVEPPFNVTHVIFIIIIIIII